MAGKHPHILEFVGIMESFEGSSLPVLISKEASGGSLPTYIRQMGITAKTSLSFVSTGVVARSSSLLNVYFVNKLIQIADALGFGE
jgi:hypothetical protein